VGINSLVTLAGCNEILVPPDDGKYHPNAVFLAVTVSIFDKSNDMLLTEGFKAR
jgi:hypothetical protein